MTSSLLVLIRNAALVVTMLLFATAHADVTRVHFRIPAGQAPETLREFMNQSKLQLLFDFDAIRELSTQAINGEFQPIEALAKMLVGTGFSARFVNERTVTVTQQPIGAQAQATDHLQLAQADQPASSTQNVAQDSGKAPSSQVQQAQSDDVAEIVVTGTNIKGVAPAGSSMIVYTREQIDRSGYQNAEEFFRSIPQIFGGGPSSTQGRSPDDDAASNPTGATALNLRGLGGGATLVLLNGQRLAPAGSVGGFVDISAIPLSAIERVEILTDGASAIYGADAVAGVVNVITRHDFQGLETEAGYGFVTEGQLKQTRVVQTAGTRWDTGNIVASYEFLDRDPLTAGEKSFARQAPAVLSLQSGQKRHSVTAGVRQQLFPAGKFRLQGLYSDAEVEALFFDGRPTSPQLSRSIDTSQFVVSPGLQWDISDRWALNLTAGYSDYGASVNQINSRTGLTTRTETDASTGSIDAVLDGALFVLPAGQLKVALGLHGRAEEFEYITSAGTDGQDRDVTAAFAEIHIPALKQLDLNISARYEDFSDFGDSLNPKFGVSWRPMEGLTARVSFSTSFNPPNLGDLFGEFEASLLNFVDPTSPTGSYLSLFSFSTVPGLQPEEAESATAGFDYERRIGADSLRFSATYYDISFTDRISSVPYPPGATTPNLLLFRSALPSGAIIDNPDPGLVQSLIDRAIATGGLTDQSRTFYVPGPGYTQPSDVKRIIRVGRQNLSSVQTHGIDLQVEYGMQTRLGAWNFGVSGDYILGFDKQAGDNTPVVAAVDTIFNPARLRLRGHVALNWQGLSTAAFLNYTSDTDDIRSIPFVPIDAFTTVDLNASYDFGREGGRSFLGGLSVYASALNVLDEAPPFVRTDPAGYSIASYDSANANPLGRLITFGLRKRW